jgi:monofunctional biosynthetic peptidoglycan transglycosylase
MPTESAPKSRRRAIVRIVKWTVLALVALPFLYVGFYLVYPDVGALKDKNPEKTAFMKYRERQWREKGEKRAITQKWVPLSRISPSLVKAVIIAEDDKFWTHEGFDFDALHDAAVTNLKQKKIRFGGSTISQQLAKNLYLSPEKSLTRKLAEAIITWRMERTLSKRRMLELYLNVAEWGNGVFGAEAAARAHFRTSASSLTPGQAARLAVALPSPLKYRTDGSSRYVERRAQHILSIMERRGDIAEAYDELMNSGESSPSTESASPPEIPAASPDSSSAAAGSLYNQETAPEVDSTKTGVEQQEFGHESPER